MIPTDVARVLWWLVWTMPTPPRLAFQIASCVLLVIGPLVVLCGLWLACQTGRWYHLAIPGVMYGASATVSLIDILHTRIPIVTTVVHVSTALVQLVWLFPALRDHREVVRRNVQAEYAQKLQQAKAEVDREFAIRRELADQLLGPCCGEVHDGRL